MSKDFWKPDMSTPEGARRFDFDLAVRLIRGTITAGMPWKLPRADIGRVDLTENTYSGVALPIEILAIEVLRHLANREETPPHLSASFLDECMATLGEVHEPVTQLWLEDRGFDSTDTTYQGTVMILPEPSGEPRNRFAFDISPETMTAHRWMIYSGYGCEYAHLLGIGPTAAQVLTVGRALGIPTERRV